MISEDPRPDEMLVALDSLEEIVIRLLARFDVGPKNAIKMLREAAREYLEESA